MPVTVIDYEPEASALNRENRALLAIAAAKEALADRGLLADGRSAQDDGAPTAEGRMAKGVGLTCPRR